jgi:LysM repeat protein
LRNCNPELCQAVTPPGDSPYDLCVPIGTGESVQAAVASCPLPVPEEKPAAKALAFKNTGEARVTVATATGSCTVKPGDTWFSLARKYQCSVDALASLNGLKPSPQSLKTGQTLKIPAKGPVILAVAKKDTIEKQQNPIATPAKATRPAQKSCVSYPVRPGDTLWSIAGRFHISVEELSAHNKVGQSQKLVAGNTLTICSDASQLPAEGMGKKKN